MNVTNTAPPIQGSAAHAGGVTAAKAPEGGGLADLFAALLASMQAAEPPVAETAIASCVVACEDGGETVAPDDSTGEDAATPAAVGSNATVPEITPAALAAVVVAPATAVQVAANDPETQDQSTPGVSDVLLPGDDAENDVTAQRLRQAVAPLTGETAIVLMSAVESDDAVADFDALAAPNQPVKPDAPAPRGNGLGAMVVEAVREGQTLAASTEDAPGRTIRQLVQDAIAGVRERTQSAVVNPPLSDGDQAAPVEMMVAASKPAVDTVPELRPAPAEASTKAVAQLALNAVAASGGGGESANSVTTASHRESARASLPQSVDVRDVGDFTVRSVRYLSGRTEETVTVRLVPRSLGELHVSIRTAAEGLEVVLTAAGSVARDRLEGQLVGLRDALAREGLDVTRVTVQTQPAFDLSGQMPSHQHQHSQTGHAPRFAAQAFREPEPNPSEAQQHPRPGRPQHEGGLNMLA